MIRSSQYKQHGEAQMDDYTLLEYRPGRWAKVDARTGDIVGPASPREITKWQQATEVFPTEHRLFDRRVPEPEAQPDIPESKPEPPPEKRQPDLPERKLEPPPGKPQPDVSKSRPELPPDEPQPDVLERKLEPPPQKPQPDAPERKHEPPPDEPQPDVPESKPEPPPDEPQPDVPESKPEPPPEKPQPDVSKSKPELPPDEPQPDVPESKPDTPSPPSPEPELQGIGTGAAKGMTLFWPLVKKHRTTSSFQDHKDRNPPSKAPGLDFGCPTGTEVRAWTAGKVIRSRWSAGGGRSLWIQHGRGLKTYYAHLNCVCVLEGESVSAGQKIGETGSTGHSTGPHLHFSTVRKSQYVDPDKLLVFEEPGKV
jgi:murein DD-endopeptidase MepM/ murein hydrolase activator NlpD